MARYDAEWGRFGRGGYDQPYPPTGFGPGDGGYGGAGRWRPEGRPGGPGGRGTGESSFGEGMYGPERYGLGPYHERLRRRRRDDDELREEVEEALFYDTWVDAEAITVEVTQGIVTLRGQLPSYEEIRYATDDAWDVDGVIGVRSELTVGER